MGGGTVVEGEGVIEDIDGVDGGTNSGGMLDVTCCF